MRQALPGSYYSGKLEQTATRSIMSDMSTFRSTHRICSVSFFWIKPFLKRDT
jgi:hypothetical protein